MGSASAARIVAETWVVWMDLIKVNAAASAMKEMKFVRFFRSAVGCA